MEDILRYTTLLDYRTKGVFVNGVLGEQKKDMDLPLLTPAFQSFDCLIEIDERIHRRVHDADMRPEQVDTNSTSFDLTDEYVDLARLKEPLYFVTISARHLARELRHHISRLECIDYRIDLGRVLAEDDHR